MALRVFRSLREAKDAGFEPYDRAPLVFLFRRKVAGKWELAAVQLSAQPSKKR